MSEATSFFEDFHREMLLSVATLAPGKIIRYNAATKRADIQPLFLTADKQNIYKQSLIEDVPVLKHCQADCKPEAVVFYIPTQRSLADLNGGSFIDPDSHDLMSSNDAVVIGVWDG